MSFASRYNKGNKFTINTEGFTYKKISDIATPENIDNVYMVAALYINTKGKFEDHPVAVLPQLQTMVDLPPHMTEQVREILADDEAIKEIEAGKVGIKFEVYMSKTYNRQCLGCRWVDL